MTAAQPLAARFVSAASPLVIAQLATSGLLLLNTILLARILGVQAYGLLAIGVAMYGITAFIGDAGLGIWGLRVIDDDPDRWATVNRLTAARTITVTFALLATLTALAILPFPAGSVAPSVVMVLTMIPAGFSVDWALIGLERTGMAATVRLAVAGTVLLFSPAGAMSAGPIGAAVGYLGATAAGGVLSWVLLVRVIGLPRLVRPTGVIQTLRRSLPMGVSAVLSQAYWQSDTLLTGMLLGAAAAGAYSAPMRLLAVLVGFRWAVGVSLLPIFRAVDLEGPDGASALATTATRLLVLACVPAVGVVIGGASAIVTGIFGPGFAESAPVLAIGAVTVGIWLCTAPVGYAILARRQDNRYLAATAASVISSAPLILLLGPAYGIVGVAASMLIAIALTATILLIEASRSGLKVNSISASAIVGGIGAVVGCAAAASAPWAMVGVILVGLFVEVPFAVALVRTIAIPGPATPPGSA
jgi:PST family polysaccharide transporter